MFWSFNSVKDNTDFKMFATNFGNIKLFSLENKGDAHKAQSQ